MVFVLLTYGGWNEAAYISAELRDGAAQHGARAGAVDRCIITVLYLLVNWGYWHGLGMQGMARSEAPGGRPDARGLRTGGGDRLIAVLVAISALTSINATMIVGARTNYAMGRDWPALRGLARWDGERGTPVVAMRVQCGAALLLVGVRRGPGQRLPRHGRIHRAGVLAVLPADAACRCSCCAGASPAPPAALPVPLYPLLPLLFCATCAYMLWSSLSYVYSQSLGGLNAAWIGVGVLAIGGLVLLVLRRPGNPLAVSPQRL